MAATCAWLVALVTGHSADDSHGESHHWCGFGDERHGVHDPIVVPGAVQMHDVSPIAAGGVGALKASERRRLYSVDASGVTNSACAALWNQGGNGVKDILTTDSTAMTTRGLKVHFNWEAVDLGTDQAMCNATAALEGHSVDPCNAWPSEHLESCAFQCTAAKEATAKKVAIAKKRAAWLTPYLASLLTVRSTASIDPTFAPPMSFATTPVANVDLIIMMTMRSDSRKNIAGSARCTQEDACGRCVVGHFNWVPDMLDAANEDASDAIATQRHTALHEIVHVLGGMALNRQFRNGTTGAALPPSDVVVVEDVTYNGVTRKVKKIVTPRALAVFRAQSGCSTLNGVPIEDQAVGVDAHWEARVLGSEVMAYVESAHDAQLHPPSFPACLVVASRRSFHFVRPLTRANENARTHARANNNNNNNNELAQVRRQDGRGVLIRPHSRLLRGHRPIFGRVRQGRGAVGHRNRCVL